MKRAQKSCGKLPAYNAQQLPQPFTLCIQRSAKNSHPDQGFLFTLPSLLKTGTAPLHSPATSSAGHRRSSVPGLRTGRSYGCCDSCLPSPGYTRYPDCRSGFPGSPRPGPPDAAPGLRQIRRARCPLHTSRRDGGHPFPAVQPRNRSGRWRCWSRLPGRSSPGE